MGKTLEVLYVSFVQEPLLADYINDVRRLTAIDSACTTQSLLIDIMACTTGGTRFATYTTMTRKPWIMVNIEEYMPGKTDFQYNRITLIFRPPCSSACVTLGGIRNVKSSRHEVHDGDRLSGTHQRLSQAISGDSSTQAGSFSWPGDVFQRRRVAADFYRTPTFACSVLTSRFRFFSPLRPGSLLVPTSKTRHVLRMCLSKNGAQTVASSFNDA